jgi:hypothetical protein
MRTVPRKSGLVDEEEACRRQSLGPCRSALSAGTPPGFLIYYLKDGELASATCARQVLTLKIRDNFTHWTYSLSADQIVDVVAAERHAGDEAVQEH